MSGERRKTVPKSHIFNDHAYIPVAFQFATLLAAFAHPAHLLLAGSRGFAYLLPSSNLKYFGYRQSVMLSRHKLLY
ncbi:MAG: hypothetical protein QS721_01690 [Candidatus Endonucleobacter sp. (ex Gigantidas childressi)]|nr:hypothetical protein [Candidatus Endonucleobacter sp. (ex Gigantidas childressi)]